MVHIFSDASLDPKSGFGVGGFVVLQDEELCDLDPVNLRINLFEVNNTTNTRLEIYTVIEALQHVRARFNSSQVCVYSDCKTIENLPTRRSKLEGNAYRSKRTAQPLNNADLYQQFFELYDELKPKIYWLKGHTSAKDQSQLQRIFAKVDRETRHKLRELMTPSSL